MGKARDEAGNIWETDAQGNPVRLIQPAASSQGRIFSLPPNPKDVRQEQRQEAADARAERADKRAAAAEARDQAKFEQEDTMAPPPGDTTKTGEEYLATIPPSLAGQVRALMDGRRAFPTGTALRSPAVQQLIAAATQADPTLDAANAATRVATRKDFTSGKSAQNITAINTALGHLGTLSKAADALSNSNWQPYNSISNYIVTKTGDPRVKEFGIARDAVANELMRVFRGAGSGSETEIQAWKNTISSSDSPAQLKQEIAKAVDLLNSRLEALGAQYNQGLSKSADPISLLNPHAQKVFDALSPGGSGIVPDDTGGPGGGPPADGGNGPQTSAAHGGLFDPTASRSEYSDRLSSTVDSMMNAGASKAMIDATLAKQGFPPIKAQDYAAAKQWMKENPGKQYFGANITRQEPLTVGQKLASSAPAAFLLHAGDMASAGTFGAMTGEKGRGAINAMTALHPEASLVGDITGGAAGAAGLEAGVAARAPAALAKYAPRIADTIYGGLTGFNQSEEGQGLKGAGIGALAGLGGGIAGDYGMRGLGKVAQGVTDPAVQRLRQAGIPLTVGEIIGPRAKAAQDALTSVFGPGDMVARRYAEGRQAMNQAAFNRAGDVVNTPINAVGNEGIGLLDAAKSNAYSQALDPVSLNFGDQSLQEPWDAILARADKIPAGELPEGFAGVNLRHYIGGNIAPDGTMTGPGFQNAYRGLAQTANKAAPKIEGHDVGEVLGQGKDLLASTLEEQNPGAYADFLKANAANRHLSILRDAVGAAKNQDDQLFTPAQLNSAAFANTAKFSGKTAAAMGDGPFQQLATDAQQVMSSKLPDSGTGKRLAMTALATGAGTSGGYGLDNGQGAAEGGLGTILLLAAGGSRPAQRAMTTILADRPQLLDVVGEALARNARLGRTAGAGTSTALFAN